MVPESKLTMDWCAPSAYVVLFRCVFRCEKKCFAGFNVHWYFCWKPQPEFSFITTETVSGQYTNIFFVAEIKCLSCFGPNVVWQKCLLRIENPGCAPVFSIVFWRVHYFLAILLKSILHFYFWIILLKDSQTQLLMKTGVTDCNSVGFFPRKTLVEPV